MTCWKIVPSSDWSWTNILSKDIGPVHETSVCEGIHSFLNIYTDFKNRFAGMWDFGDLVSLLLSRDRADSKKCLFCPMV